MKRTERILLSLYLLVLLAGSCVDFFDIAWGTGVWLGELALTWGILFGVFCVACLSVFIVISRVIWNDASLARVVDRLIASRRRLKWGRWLLAAAVFALPIWFLQFTVYGIVFQGLYLRLGIWSLEMFFISYLLTRKDHVLIDWKVFLILLVLTASSFSISASLKFVTDYPFSLGWSEGNRLWDYSILYGRDRYDYAADQPIDVYLDLGRQSVGGLPFLIPGLTIDMERTWVALTSILPYIFLGLVAFRFSSRQKYVWLAAVLWTYLFLKQGPIHPPLVLFAALVALAWRSKLWFSIPLIVFGTYFARVSRFTWMFAPAIWIFQLWYLDTSSNLRGKALSPARKFFKSSTFLGALAGILIAAVVVYIQFDGFDGIRIFLSSFWISPESLKDRLTQQPLLWYRLLPNETYGSGILIGLIFATLPLMLVLLYLVIFKKWMINIRQRWVIVLPLSAFLCVGLIVSTKIGGGGDLHNMDMFLIGLFFVALAAFYNGVKDWLENSWLEPMWIKVVLVFMVVIPSIGPLKEMRSYDFGSAGSWLVALTDVANARSLDLYPSDEVVKESLAVIQAEVDLAKAQGPVLFMDQRQLLTFNFIQNVPLVPEYDKKALIEKAITSDDVYFQEFYQDLETGRFSLIITQPLNTPRKGSEYEFGEENNAWVDWVAKPLLCFYEIEKTLVDVNVQLLVPRTGAVDCSQVLP